MYPPQHGHTPPPPPPAPRRRRTGIGFAIALVIAILAGVGCTALVTVLGDTRATTSSSSGQPLTLTDPTEQPTEEETTPAAAYTPKPSDFKIRVIILEKSCYGSAGCNVTFRIKPSYSGPDLADDQKFDVVYEVSGTDDGSKTNTFSMTGTRAEFDAKEFVSTPPSPRLKAKVTEVLSTGL